MRVGCTGRLLATAPALALLALSAQVYAEGGTTPRATTPHDEAPARALPRTRTVCIDRAAARCWTEPGESACASGDARDAAPFRVVIDGAGRDDVARALADCEAALRGAAR